MFQAFIGQALDTDDPDVKTSGLQAAVEAISFDTLTLYDSNNVNDVVVYAESNRLNADSPTIGSKAIAWTSDLAGYQPLNAFLTTLIGINATVGTGALVRAVSPTLTTPNIGAATASSIICPGLVDLRPASTANIIQFGTNGFLRSDTSQLTLYNAGTAANAISFNRNGTTLNLASTYILGWGSTTQADSGTVDTTLSRNAAGVVQIGTTAANALGSLLVAGVTIGAGTKILKVLSSAATLDFGSVAANSFADLTIMVTGAALGDTVSLGVPNGSILNDISFFGWVSATNTVTIRCSNVSNTTARDPASGTFRATVTQF